MIKFLLPDIYSLFRYAPRWFEAAADVAIRLFRGPIDLKARFVALLFLSGLWSVSAAQKVEIPDPNLNAAIRIVLNIPNADITVEDMERLTVLDASLKSNASNLGRIQSLEGLETAVNLQVLNLSGAFIHGGGSLMDIRDFSPLNELSNLTVLNLRGNHPDDLSFLFNKPKLSELDLEYNRLGDSGLIDFSFLEDMKELRRLDLSWNGLTTFTLPEGLNLLESLELWDNELISLSLPADLGNLAELILWSNELASLTLPEHMSELRVLNLDNNQLTEFSLPMGLTKLRELWLGQNQIASLALPEGLEELAFINLDFNQLMSLTLPRGLNDMDYLTLRENPITALHIPISMKLDDVGLNGFSKFDVTYYDDRVGVSGRFIDSGQEAISGPPFNPPSSYGGDVALGDLDGDGDLDAWAANRGRDKIWINDGHGRFEDSGQSFENLRIHDVALDDFDGDGALDAWVMGSKSMQVWMNDGQGWFTDTGQSFWFVGNAELALGDLDGDDDADACIATSASIEVFLNEGNGHFTAIDSVSIDATADWVTKIALGDLDSDGDLDVWLRNIRTSKGTEAEKGDLLWLNDGSARFSDSGQALYSPTGGGLNLTLGDLDGDTDIDALSGGVVWLNDGEGTFSSSGQTLKPAPNSQIVDVALGDVDGDGDLDAFCANLTDFGFPYDQVWLNNGTARFTDSGQKLGPTWLEGATSRRADGSYGPALGVNSYGVALGDLDGDGDLDAWVAESATERVWLNGAIPEVRISRRDGNILLDYRGTLLWSDSPTEMFNRAVVSWSSPYVVPLDQSSRFFIAK